MNFLENVSGNNNSFWKYVVTFAVAFIAAGFIGNIPLLLVVFKNCLIAGVDLTKIGEVVNDPSMVGISQNFFLFLMLFAFAVGLLTIILVIKIIHKRSFSETVNGTKTVRWNRVFTGFGVWFILVFVLFIVSYFIDPDDLIYQFELKTFIPLLFI